MDHKVGNQFLFQLQSFNSARQEGVLLKFLTKLTYYPVLPFTWLVCACSSPSKTPAAAPMGPTFPANFYCEPTVIQPQDCNESLRHFIIRLETVTPRNSLCSCDACFMKLLHSGQLLANKPGHAYQKLRDSSVLKWTRTNLYDHLKLYTAECCCHLCTNFLKLKERIGKSQPNLRVGYIVDSLANERAAKTIKYSWPAGTMHSAPSSSTRPSSIVSAFPGDLSVASLQPQRVQFHEEAIEQHNFPGKNIPNA